MPEFQQETKSNEVTPPIDDASGDKRSLDQCGGPSSRSRDESSTLSTENRDPENLSGAAHDADASPSLREPSVDRLKRENSGEAHGQSIGAVGPAVEKPATPNDRPENGNQGAFLDTGYSHAHGADFPDLPRDESRFWFHESGWARRSGTNQITIETKVLAPVERKHFERQCLPIPSEMDLPGFQRLHAQGAGLGIESPYGIAYGPAVVNQEYQRLQIEDKVKDIYEMKRDDVELFLRTEVTTSIDGLKLESVNYELYAESAKSGRETILAASIEISGPVESPAVAAEVGHFDTTQLEKYLKPVTK